MKNKQTYKYLMVLFFIFFFIGFSSCQTSKNHYEVLFESLELKNDRHNKTMIIPNKILFSYNCIIDNPFSAIAFATYKTELEILEKNNLTISNAEEMALGKKILIKLQKDNKIINDEPTNNDLKMVLISLLKARPSEKRDISYEIFLVDDISVNAFTVGGKIFIHTGLIEFCETISELAFVIAHEIAHTEKYHINLNIKRLKIAGELGEPLLFLKNITTMSFNQFNEIEADCYAIDLIYASGYSIKNAAQIWNRMSLSEKTTPTIFEDFFRTHPNSTSRFYCLKQHIETNYQIIF